MEKILITNDGLGRVTFKEITDGLKSHNTSINYNKIGLVEEKNVGGYLESFEYNEQGFLKKHIYPEYSNRYTYDSLGNTKGVLTMKDIYHVQTANYTYDALDRMISASDQEGLQASYVYDVNGNRESLKYLNESFGCTPLVPGGILIGTE